MKKSLLDRCCRFRYRFSSRPAGRHGLAGVLE